MTARGVRIERLEGSGALLHPLLFAGGALLIETANHLIDVLGSPLACDHDPACTRARAYLVPVLGTQATDAVLEAWASAVEPDALCDHRLVGRLAPRVSHVIRTLHEADAIDLVQVEVGAVVDIADLAEAVLRAH